MSPENSTKRVTKPAPPVDDAVSAFQPWHLFLIMTLLATAAAAVAVRGTGPANVIFICLIVASAGLAGYGVYRTLWPLVQPEAVESPEMLGGETRSALEREKALLLRAITELEFDRAMGKVSESDWQEMTARLRTRAVRVISRLDRGGAAYLEVIERELTARKAAGQGPTTGGRSAAAVGRSTAPLLCVAVALSGALLALPARAQMGGAAGAAGMPDAKAMSGIPRPDPSLPIGTVSVRLVRGQVSNLVVGKPVEFIVTGQSRVIPTDATGHAVAAGLAPGASVRAVATVGGERIDSQEFQVPPQGGVVIMLVASDTAGAAPMATGAVAGTVTIGGQSRIATQFEDEELQVYYLFDIVNKLQTPVTTAGPLVFDLPSGAENVTLLEGSTPRAAAKGSKVTVAGPFAPGVTNLLIAYSIAPAARVSIRQRLPIAMDQVAVMVEKLGSIVLTSPQLTTIREGSDGGKEFVIGTGPGLKADDVLSLDISGLPHPATWPRDTALALAVVTLVVGAWGAARTGGRSGEAAARQHLEARRERAFAELLALDARRQAGSVGADEAANRRGHLLAELEKIYGELDTGGADSRAGQGPGA
jgi:hypothetical protein